MQFQMLGRSVRGNWLSGHCSARTDRGGTLIFAGFHGDEPKSVYVARELLKMLEDDALRGLPPWMIVPLVNPDGFKRKRRCNAHSVDINRNFPTKDWAPGAVRSRMFGGTAPAGEPETRAVMRAVARFRPARIITIHSISGSRQCNNYDGPGKRLAAMMARLNGYPVTDNIGYPTPGSFGTWAGIERKIPTITLELPARHSPRKCWDDNREALLRAIRLKSD